MNNREDIKKIVFDAVANYFIYAIKGTNFSDDPEKHMEELREMVEGHNEVIRYVKENLK